MRGKGIEGIVEFFKVSSQRDKTQQLQLQAYVCKMPQNIVKERAAPGSVPALH
jgi:hypothetical protein